MTEFIVHREFTTAVSINNQPIGENYVYAPRGTKAYYFEDNGLITLEDYTYICDYASEFAQLHLCRNDDGYGLMRGKLTYAIAYADRSRIHSDGVVSRFSEAEIDEILNNWKHFIHEENKDTILFKSDFFNADINDLKKLAKLIHIRVNLSEFESNTKTPTVINNDIQYFTREELSNLTMQHQAEEAARAGEVEKSQENNNQINTNTEADTNTNININTETNTETETETKADSKEEEKINIVQASSIYTDQVQKVKKVHKVGEVHKVKEAEAIRKNAEVNNNIENKTLNLKNRKHILKEVSKSTKINTPYKQTEQINDKEIQVINKIIVE